MYEIKYWLSGYSKNSFEKTFHAVDSDDAAEMLIKISKAYPITKMQFGEGKWIDPKLYYHYTSPQKKQWYLDYGVNELRRIIRKALRKDGIIKVWHDPYFGTRF
ncbi:hypothetical protein LDC_0847 [sediment metagenome]|uniref:Uncharacterized protein n=1 Tax=sediment metagenome TaxID=749907 RepID=D9PH48_9ZZZZ